MKYSRLALWAPLALALLSAPAQAKITVGEKPAPLVLKDDDGALVKDGSAWSSDSLKGKVHLVLYVDPDQSDLNDAFTEQVKKQEFPHDKFASVAIINMAATWKPNAIISSVLEGKQKDYPHTIYVKDLKSKLVKDWGLPDDSYSVLVLDSDGTVRYHKDGKLEDSDIKAALEAIRSAIDAKK